MTRGRGQPLGDLTLEPPLGEDSALLTRSTSNQEDWAAIVDVTIGTSCLAATDGCH